MLPLVNTWGTSTPAGCRAPISEPPQSSDEGGFFGFNVGPFDECGDDLCVSDAGPAEGVADVGFFGSLVFPALSGDVECGAFVVGHVVMVQEGVDRVPGSPARPPEPLGHSGLCSMRIWMNRSARTGSS